MKEFSNLKKEIEFEKYVSTELDLTRHTNHHRKNFISCGSAALGLLLNKNPLLLDKVCKDAHKGWYTTQVIQYLKSQNCKVIQLSKDDVLPKFNHLYNPITSDHVLLINSRVNKNENSMFVIHNNVIWHNYNSEQIPPLFFINKPTQDVLLVHHPKWKLRTSRPQKLLYVNAYSTAS